MTKFLLVMYLCSHISGNACKQFKPEYTEFKTYKECATYGYKYSAELLDNFSDTFVEDYRTYTIFDCFEQSTT